MFDGRTLTHWLDKRTGFREMAARWRDPKPVEAHWARTLGIVLFVLLVVQLVTGITLMMYYAPTPTHAYDSIRYIMSELPAGRLLRGLHYYGASLLIAITVLHLLHALYVGAYKSPREFTWLSGFGLLVLLLAFGLTGYLLPWDQMGYWASVVRTNIAGTTPVIGTWLSLLMKGGEGVGALTLSRWYALHVAVLPAAAVIFIVAHFYLVRHHGRAGHYNPLRRAPKFIPNQTVRNALAIVAVFGGLLAIATSVDAPLESMADPADVAFIPHPEWYFSWLFQLMKMGSGAVQEFGAPMVLNVVIAFLVLLPFVDRTGHRHPLRRAWVMAAVAVGLIGITSLTVIALRETPPGRDPHVWSPVAIAGQQITERKVCRDCHGIVAPDLARGHVSHDNAWIKNHLSDPEVMAPGIRPIPFDAPTKAEVLSVVAYQRMVRAGAPAVSHTEEESRFALLYATACASCHRMDGDGIEDGPDLSHAGKEHDARWIAEKTINPTAEDPKARMPSFKDQMSQEDVDFLATVLARRK